MNNILYLVLKKLRWYFDFFFSAVNSNEKIIMGGRTYLTSPSTATLSSYGPSVSPENSKSPAEAGPMTRVDFGQ